MVDAQLRDAGDDRQDHVGGVQPAAEPDLDHAGIGRRAGEGEERGGGGHFEKAGADAVRVIEHLF